LKLTNQEIFAEARKYCELMETKSQWVDVESAHAELDVMVSVILLRLEVRAGSFHGLQAFVRNYNKFTEEWAWYA
jgi:hypothetical protein